jgi:gas vesicle protein
MKNLISFLSGAIMGALVGATIAILMAPDSGENLREDMRKRFTQFQDELSQAANTKRSELEKKLEEMKRPQSTEAT